MAFEPNFFNCVFVIKLNQTLFKCFTYVLPNTKNVLPMANSVTIVFNRKKNASAKICSPVEIRITSNRKSYYISTGIKCKIHEFKNGQVIKRLDMDSCNETISQMLNRVRELVGTMEEIDISAIKSNLEIRQDNRPNLYEWLFKRLNERPMRESTKRQHKVSLEFMQSSGLIKSWDDINVKNITMLNEMLHNKGYVQATIHSYHKRIKPYINDAIKFGYIEKNPYDVVKIPRGKSERLAYLTEQEIAMIENSILPKGRLDMVRDCFLFQAYTGLAFVDASSLGEDNFIEHNGSLYIVSKRVKCDSDIRIRVMPKALGILEKYEYKLPWISLQKYNILLKELAAKCGLNKRLTSHMARHTFATSALHKGVPIEVVSKMLSHSNIQTTQIYAKVLSEDVEKGFDLLEK